MWTLKIYMELVGDIIIGMKYSINMALDIE